MIWKLLYELSAKYSPFNLFHYITFRIIYALLTALFVSFALGPWVIRALKRHQMGQVIRDDGPQTHKKKAGTPTMGGLLILVSVAISSVFWVDLQNPLVWAALFALYSFGAVGFADDYLKVVRKNPKGIGAKAKFLAQLVLAVVVGWLLSGHLGAHSHDLLVPFFKQITPHLPVVLYLVFALLVIVGTSNAVNLTDGLDGLAILPVTICSASYALLCYLAGNVKFASYLNIFYVPGAGEVAVLCGAVVGASLGFLWFNSYPAEMFMGDTGSLSLGAFLGTVSLIAKQELLLVVIGGIFVIETLSVMIQVGFFKSTGGKRVFRMAPIHHHFEQLGLPEPKVIVRFWIISIVLALIGLSTLKIR
jgi:phospho-N-acetylmuramoyl-pentapeptide-transferase